MENPFKEKYWLPFGTVKQGDLKGKINNLCLLRDLGYSVPEFGAVTPSAYKYWYEKKTSPYDLKELKSHEGLLAVRSSHSLEDGSHQSFAGLFHTELNVRPVNVTQAIEKVFESAQNPKIQNYFQEIAEFSVIIQRQVLPVASGVCFSRRPIGNSSLACVEVGKGLGDGVVSGTVSVERWELNRFLQITNLTLADGGESILNSKQAREVVRVALKLESQLGYPVDIEWAVDSDSKLWLLQVRPITSKMPKLIYLTDTNLAESYPGKVSVATADLVKKLYLNTFFSAAEFFGASVSRLEELKPFYANLIVLVKGHLYYDLISYANSLFALPGTKKNFIAWKQMIGLEGDFDFKIYSFGRLSIGELISFSKALYLLSPKFDKTITKALKFNDEHLLQLQQKESRIEVIMQELDQPPSFALAVVNDVVLMKLFSRLEKRCKNLGLNVSELIDSDEQGSLASVEPERELDRLIELTEDLSVDVDSMLSNFLHKYGDRCFEDLKLESMSFKEDYSRFQRLFQWRKKNRQVVERNAQKLLKAPNSLKSLLFKIKKSIRYREAFRLQRSQYFAWFRKSLLGVFGELQNKNLILFKGFEPIDIFHVDFELLRNYSRGHVTLQNVIDTMKLNKDEYEHFPGEYPQHLILEEGDGQGPIFKKEWEQECSQENKGIAASPGKVRGKALVLNTPEEAFEFSDIENYILVTKTTDPAWVYLMSKCKGLVSERGSLLSHTAIIGRELKIPAVVGIRGVTKSLKTNDWIEVDGFEGTVQLLDSNQVV